MILAKKKDETKPKVLDKPSIVLSEYGERLENHVKCRYLDKIAVIGVDPASLFNSQLDPECLPPVEAGDLVSYLVLETSFYTLQQFKCFKSLEAYNQMVSGFITSVQGKVVSDKFVVIGKVRHSQRMNEAPLSVWLISSKEGTIISAHCLGCKAGLAESCSHIASVLFYIEAWTRINGKLACTQVKCTWLLPTYVKEVAYAEVKDINFRSARRLKAELDKNIDEGKVNVVDDSASSNTSKSLQCTPTDKEMDDLFLKLNYCKRKPAILSLVPPYADSFVLKSRRIPAMTDLFDPENLKLNYIDVLTKCSEIDITLSDSELNLIEQDTRDQAQTSAFFTHRAGRIGASQSHSAVHTNPAQPSISLVKSICYPQLFKVTTKATVYGCKNEAKAIDAYTTAMSAKHKDFKVTKCGMFIDKNRPWMHATPDFLSTCACCGDGCGEVKCPYGLKDGEFKSYVQKKSSCLEMIDGSLQLKRNHLYYYQTQQHLLITGRRHCDFTVCAFLDTGPIFFMERIMPDPGHWEVVVPKITKMWRTCILPELTSRWYTRKQHMPNVPSNEPKGICYCRKLSDERTLDCSNHNCVIKKFHYSCLRMSDPIPKTWYCPSCRLLPQFQKKKKTTKACDISSHNDEAMTLTSVCICGKKPSTTDKLLKCHNSECKNGQFFHLHCLDYKRMPNNSRTTWMCSNCKVSRTYQPAVQGPSQISQQTAKTPATTCSSFNLPPPQSGNNVNIASTNIESDDSSDDDVEITKVTQGITNKKAPLGDLTENHFDIIMCPNGWLDCTIIQQAQLCLQRVNPLIEGFQRTTLGPIKNFDIVTGEFVQILNTGSYHWVCVSSNGCQRGMVNLYDSLYHDVIEMEVTDQVQSLMADSFIGITNKPVQQQKNGSDCGIFAIAFATSLVYGSNPQDFTFDIPKMRLHLLQCLKNEMITMFPSF